MTPTISATERTRMRRRSLAPVVALVGATVLLTAGCGSDEPAASGGTSAPIPTVSDSESEVAQVDVTETEFTIELSEPSLAPGEYTFAIANEGAAPHNLAISGPGVDEEISDTIDGGQSGELRLTLEDGTYTLWCAVGNHRAQGMETTIEVTG